MKIIFCDVCFHGQRFECLTEDRYINNSNKVRIIYEQGAQLTVREIEVEDS